MAIKILRGSCDCGKVTFEAGLDPEKGTFKCNCVMCTKYRFWGAVAEPGTFRLLSGEDFLTVYGQKRRHFFCKVCGIKIYGRGLDGVRTVFSVGALDEVEPQWLLTLPVRYVDGRNDNFNGVPDVTAHL